MKDGVEASTLVQLGWKGGGAKGGAFGAAGGGGGAGIGGGGGGAGMAEDAVRIHHETNHRNKKILSFIINTLLW